jgi:hypothetical protein
MILIPRGLARAFRAVARKCMVGRPRGPAPPVTLRTDGERLTLATTFDGVSLSVEVAMVEASSRTLMVPMEVLDAVEGSAAELSASGSKGSARWEDREGPREMAFEAIKGEPRYDLPFRPETMHPVPSEFLTALHECGRTASREVVRFALHRVQVNGKAGNVVATDGKQALVWGGFKFTFPDSVLLPAIPLFGSKELSSATVVQIGRSKDRFVIQASAWTVFLAIDTSSRFPDVASVIPKSRDTSLAGIDERDAADLLSALPDLPGVSAEVQAVTLDLDGGVCVRGRDEEIGEVKEVRLLRSPSAGPKVRVALDRRALARALSLGCVSLRVVSGKPLVAEGPNRTFISVVLDASAAVPPSDAATTNNRPPTPIPELERRMVPMKSHETNGNGPPARPEPAIGNESLDPLAEAEGLRAALSEAAARAGRLVQCLKQFRRQRRALETAWSSLKSIGIGPGGGA